jgi:predicted deacetylase
MVVAIHDVAPAFETQIDRLLGLTEAVTGQGRLAMLIVPDHWNGGSLKAGSRFATRVRDWSDAGIEMILHGWSHRDDSSHERRADAFRARHFTAGEGEFLGLGKAEARDRLMRGRTLLEDIIGRPVNGFIAPAWLYGKGAKAALGECGFTMAEDHMRVWNPASGRRMVQGPVISWASRSRTRIASSLLFAMVAPVLLARQHLVRIALHPGDAAVPELVNSIERTLRHFGQHRAVVRYADL